MQDNYDLYRDITKPPDVLPDIEPETSQGQVALEELSRILESMGIKSQVFYQEKNEIVNIEIHSANPGLVIGKHGQTLDALEFILNVIHRKRYSDAKLLILDAQGYREKKKGLLKKILYDAKEHALRTNRDVELEPMPAYDRKTIHLLSQNIHGIITESRGKGMNRRVIIRIDDNEGSVSDYDSFVN